MVVNKTKFLGRCYSTVMQMLCWGQRLPVLCSVMPTRYLSILVLHEHHTRKSDYCNFQNW